MKDTRKLVYMAMFVALEIVLTRLVSLMPSNITRISLTFVVYAFAGNMFGPIFTATTALVGDLVGTILFPPPGGFFPGFVISATLAGFIFGFTEFGEKKYPKIIALLVIKTLLVDALLTTTWLKIMTKTPFNTLLISRIPGMAINFFLAVSILFVLNKTVQKGGLYENRHRDRTSSTNSKH